MEPNNFLKGDFLHPKMYIQSVLFLQPIKKKINTDQIFSL